MVIRPYDLWWHDLCFYIDQVEKARVRAWVWSDYLWHYPDRFFERMGKSVLQSNWYYLASFDPGIQQVKAYLDLEANGYDQVPTGGNTRELGNFAKTVEFCSRHIASDRLKGFLQTCWQPTVEARRQRHMETIDAVGRARAELIGKG